MNRDQELGTESMDNVVSFPFGGSERISPSVPPITDLNDPLEELLNEFADWEIDEEDWEPTPVETHDLSTLFPSVVSNNTDDDIELLAHQVSLLEDVTKRLKFYLDEIELFTPHLRK